MTAEEALKSIPKLLLIGIGRYTVKVVDIVDADDPDCKAIFEPDNQKIKIGRNHATAALVVGSLLHEGLHAIWDDQGLPHKVSEERAIVALEKGLVALLGDNPKLMRWVAKGLKK